MKKAGSKPSKEKVVLGNQPQNTEKGQGEKWVPWLFVHPAVGVSVSGASRSTVLMNLHCCLFKEIEHTFGGGGIGGLNSLNIKNMYSFCFMLTESFADWSC